MNRSIRFVFLGLLFSLGASGCATYRVHPDFKERQKSLKTMACLPPDVEVHKITFTGTKEPMHDLYPLVAKYTTDELKRILEEKGYTMQSLDLSEPALAQEPELRTNLHTIQELYKKTLENIAKRRQKKFTYTIGSEINPLADRAQADALLLVKWVAYKKTGGEIAKDIAKTILIAAATLGNVVPVFNFSEGLIQLAVVDGSTGDVLWYHTNFGNTAVNVSEEDQVKKAVKQLIRPFPISTALAEEKKAKKRRGPSRHSDAPIEEKAIPAPVIPLPAGTR